MELEEGDSVTLRLSLDEADRLGEAIAAGYETVSRGEYYIHRLCAAGHRRRMGRACDPTHAVAVRQTHE